MKESDIQTQCNDLLRKLKIPFWHKEKGKYNNKYHSDGFVDLFIMHKSKTYLIELKKNGGIVSDKQLEFMKKFASEGAITRIFFNYEEFEMFILYEVLMPSKKCLIDYKLKGIINV